AHAPPEIDTTRLLEVAYRHRHVAQAEPEPHRLYQELSVEDEVVGVLLEGNALQHRAAIDAEAAVEIAKVLTQGEVLDRRQEAVGKVLPRRHPALERLVARTNATAQHHVANTQLDESDYMRDHTTVVLVVRVDHHHDVGAAFQGVAVTRLLVSTV